MAFVTLVYSMGVGIIPAFNKTESKSKSSTQDSDCYHEKMTLFLAQMLVAEVNVLEKALSAGLNPSSQWHCTSVGQFMLSLWLDCSYMQRSAKCSSLFLVHG